MEQFSLFDKAEDGPPGFVYLPDFLSAEEELQLVRRLVQLPFTPFAFHGFEGNRRTVSFGWRYAFEGRGALGASEPIPDFLLPLRDRAAAAAGSLASDLEHMLVTEYAAGAGIGWHKDKAVFGITIAVSLGSPCRLRFRMRTQDGWQRYSIVAEPRSLYILAGDSRSVWEHSIPPVEQLRYSITMRDLVARDPA